MKGINSFMIGLISVLSVASEAGATLYEARIGNREYLLDSDNQTATLLKDSGSEGTVPETVSYSLEGKALVFYITKIGDNFLSDNEDVTEFIVPSTIEWITSASFRDARNLEKVVFEDGGSINLGFDGKSLFQDSPVKSLYLGRQFRSTSTLDVSVTSETLCEVEVGANVTKLNDGIFFDCPQLKKVCFNDGEKALSYSTSASIYHPRQDSNRVFGETYSVEEIYLGRNIAEEWAITSYLPFRNLTTLTTLTIGPMVKSIPVGAFLGCENLKELVIPGNVETLGGSSFSGCGLEYLCLEACDTPLEFLHVYLNFNGCPIKTLYMDRHYQRWPDPMQSEFKSIETLTLGPSLKSNPDFSGFNNLKEVTVLNPNPVQLHDNPALKTVTLCEGTEEITKGAFKNDSVLEEINFPLSLKRIGDAFTGTSAFETFTIPSHVLESTLHFGSKVRTLTVEESETPLKVLTNCGTSPVEEFIVNRNLITPQSFFSSSYWTGVLVSEALKSVTIGGCADEICDLAFHTSKADNYDLSDVRIELPKGIKKIGKNAFSRFKRGSFTINAADSLHIEEGAFENAAIDTLNFIGCKDIQIADYGFGGYRGYCINIANHEKGYGISSIAGGAFSDAINLTYCPFSSKVTKIGKNAFKGINRTPTLALKNLHINEGPEIIEEGAFMGCNLDTISIKSGTKVIESESFMNSHGVILLLGDSIRDIDFKSLPGSIKEAHVKTPDLWVKVSNAASEWAIERSTIDGIPVQDYPFGDYYVPVGVRNLNYTFYKCNNLTSLHLGKDVRYLGDKFFGSLQGGCPNLKAIYLNAGLESISEILPKNVEYVDTEDVNGYAMLSRNSLVPLSSRTSHELYSNGIKVENVTLKEGLTYLVDYAFYGVESLKSITLPASMSRLGRGSLTDTNLTSIVLHEGLQEIGFDALNYKINNFDFPMSLERLYYNVPASGNVVFPMHLKEYIIAGGKSEHIATDYWEDVNLYHPGEIPVTLKYDRQPYTEQTIDSTWNIDTFRKLNSLHVPKGKKEDFIKVFQLQDQPHKVIDDLPVAPKTEVAPDGINVIVEVYDDGNCRIHPDLYTLSLYEGEEAHEDCKIFEINYNEAGQCIDEVSLTMQSEQDQWGKTKSNNSSFRILTIPAELLNINKAYTYRIKGFKEGGRIITDHTGTFVNDLTTSIETYNTNEYRIENHSIILLEKEKVRIYNLQGVPLQPDGNIYTGASGEIIVISVDGLSSRVML